MTETNIELRVLNERVSVRAVASVVIGGVLWALTPLRTPVFHAGGTPEEGELFFRSYNLLGLVIVVLLTVGLFELRRQAQNQKSRTYFIGWWMILAGNALMAAGSLPAVLLGGQARDFVMAGQDVGFLGAMLAALGAIPLGIAGVRRGIMPKAAAVLFVATLPLGALGGVLLASAGVHEDYYGLPLTVLYGGAWILLGWHWSRKQHTPG